MEGTPPSADAPPPTPPETREDRALQTIDRIEENLTPQSFVGVEPPPAPAPAGSDGGLPAWYRFADRAGRPLAGIAAAVGVLLRPFVRLPFAVLSGLLRAARRLTAAAADPATPVGRVWVHRLTLALVGNLLVGSVWLYVHFRLGSTVPLLMAAAFLGLGLRRRIGIARALKPPPAEAES